MNDLAALVIRLLKALFQIVHGDEREAKDIADQAFRRGWDELERWQRKDN